MILHITRRTDWENALTAGEYTAPSLDSDGFIHCSTIRQAVDTANSFFKGQGGLVLLCIDETRLTSECRFEDPCGRGKHDPANGTLFPHVYGSIDIFAVTKVLDFPAGVDGLFALPAELKNYHYEP